MFKKISSYTLSDNVKDKPPLVSILIPARNEEANIKRCLKSLLKQDYPLFEIIVLDDNSVDSTYDIVSKLSEKDKRLKIIKGKKLKPGWLGKSYACHQLARKARGSILLFTDADTLHFRDSVSCALAAMLSGGYGGISVFSHQIMVTFHERMMVPFGNLMILCFLPLGLVSGSKNPLFCTAIGQFMMFRKSVYRKIGGHSSVKKEILEDIHISKRVKKAGSRFMIFDGSKRLYCRMYKSLKEVIGGYSKVLFAAFDYHFLNFLIAFIMVTVIFLLPFMFLPMAVIFGWPPVLLNIIILQTLVIFLIRIIYAVRFKTRSIDILLHPVSVFYLLLIAINSFHKCRFGSGIYWKERTYDVSEEEELKLVNHSE
ncbi:MAG: glycosyltransferase [Actinomycetota bacterium]